MNQLLKSRMFLILALLVVAAEAACGSGTPTKGPVPLMGPTNVHGSPAEVQAMLNESLSYYRAKGRDQALKEFTQNKQAFVDRDMYMLCLGTDHTVTADGADPSLVGKSADDIQASNGQSLGKLIWDAAAQKPQGTVPFTWTNPATGQAESKLYYYQKLDQDVCGVPGSQP